MPYKPTNRLLYLLRQAGFEMTWCTQDGRIVSENVDNRRFRIVTKYRDEKGKDCWFKNPPRIDLN